MAKIIENAMTEPPRRCPGCGRAALGGAALRKHASVGDTQLYYRCNEFRCQRHFKVTSFSTLPLAGLVCTQIRGAIEQYTDAAGPNAPSAAQAAKMNYAGTKTMAKLFTPPRQRGKPRP